MLSRTHVKTRTTVKESVKMKQMVKLGQILSGLMVLGIGIAHFFMPTLGYSGDVIAAVPEVQRDHFVYLGTYAIGTFLVAIGVLTLLADPNSADVLHRSFFGLMVLVWGVRLVLEVIYPVEFSLFFVSNPHSTLSTAIVIVLAGYLGALGSTLRIK